MNNVDGERKTKTYGTQAKASAKLLEINNALAHGKYSDTGSQTLRQWLEDYAKDSIKLSTYISYETYIRAHIKPAIGDVKMKDLNVSTLQKFLVGLKKNGTCRPTCHLSLAPKDKLVPKLKSKKGG